MVDSKVRVDYYPRTDCVLQHVEDEEVEKTRATFHRKPQPYGPIGCATDLHSGGRRFESRWWTAFFLYQYFFKHVFWIQFWQHRYFAFQARIEERNWTHVIWKLKCWLLIDSCFVRSLQRVEGTGWCKGKTGNICYFLWCIPVKTM